MKSIILSERPKHACNILNRIKNIDIRRNAPQNWIKYLRGETDKKPEPITVYIYCSFPRGKNDKLCRNGDSWFLTDNEENYNGKIIAKFTLPEVEEIYLPYTKFGSDEEARTLQTKTMDEPEILEKARLFEDEIYRYVNFNKTPCGYAWHIEDLIIFDQPKNLSDFYKVCSFRYNGLCAAKDKLGCQEESYLQENMFGGISEQTKCGGKITKAPQSWGYCEYENKELSPLEVSKQLKEFVLEFIKNGLDIDIIETALKALEIIKEKKIDLDLLKISDDLDDYNFMCDMYYKNILTHEEYDLLKKVLL